MSSFVAEQAMARSAQDVWVYAADIVRHAEWMTITGPASTKATYGADIRLHGLWRLIAPMVTMEGKAGPARELRRLKSQVEAT